jgi:hypothetical protein
LAKKTIAELNIKTSGGQAAKKQLDQVGESTERLGRNQTRLGQASASAGRSFAAQSAGLGGIVGVYAAAAANVFALTAAFTALNRAAQFETILKGTDQLATAVGSSAQKVIGSLQDITQGQLSIIEAATQANLALSAGFNADQIEELATIALKASRTLGRNLTDSFQRITRGAIKLEPELLDEIGIFTRLDPAVEKYAASLNKSVAQLTQFERRQAFVNGIIEDGTKAFADVSLEAGSTQEKFEKLIASFSNLALTAGNLLAGPLGVFAEFLDQNLGNRIVLLGAVATLVFGRLRESIALFATQGLLQINSGLSDLADNLSKNKLNMQEFAVEAKAAGDAFKGGGALPGGGRASGAELKRVLADGNLSTQQALFFQKEIGTLLENEKNEREAILINQKNDVISKEKANEELEKSKKRTAALEKSQGVIATRLRNSSRSTKFLASGLNVAAVAARGLGTALSFAFTALNFIVAGVAGLQLLGSLFGVDVFSKIVELVSSLGKESRDTAKGIDDLGKAILDASSAVANSSFADLQDDLEKFSIREIVESARDAQRLAEQAAERGTLRAGPGAQPISAQDQAERIRGSLLQELAQTDPESDRFRELELQIAGFDLALTGAIDTLEKTGTSITALADVSQKSSKIIADGFKGGFFEIQSTLEGVDELAISIGGTSKVIGEFADGSLKLLSDELANAAVDANDARVKIEQLQDKLEEGTISTEIASRDIGVILSLIENSAVLGDEVKNALIDASQAVQDTVENFILLDQVAKSIRKTFAGDIRLADDAVVKGLISLNGELATTEQEIARFRSERLEATKETLDRLTQAQQEGKATEAERRKAESAYLAAQKAAFGFNLKNVVETTKIVKAEEKRLDALRDQTEILERQVQLSSIQSQNQIRENERLTAAALTTSRIAIEESVATLRKQQFKSTEQQLQAQQALNRETDKQAEVLERLARLRAASINIRAGAADDAAVRAAEQRLEKAQQQSVLTREQLLQLELDIEERKSTARLNAIAREEEVVRQSARDALNASQRKREQLLEEREIQRTSIDNERAILESEKALEASKVRSQIAEAQNDISRAKDRMAEIEAQKAVDLLRVDQTEAQKNAELDIVESRYQLLDAEIAANNAFLDESAKIVDGLMQAAKALNPNVNFDGVEVPGNISRENIRTGLSSVASARTELETQAQLGRRRVTESAQAASQSASGDVLRGEILVAQLEEVLDLQNETFDLRINATKDEQKAATQLLAKKLMTIDLEDQATLQLTQNKLQQLGIDREIAESAIKFARERQAFELSYQRRLVDAGNAVSSTLKSGITDGFLQLNDALIEGTLTISNLKDGFSDFASSLIKDIQRIFFQKTIAEPAADFLAKGFTSGFGNLFGTSLPPGVDVGPLPGEGGMVNGGFVKMAAGGMMRDRVPAMLEPGEFVVRKQAAKVAGAPALNSLNSTGSMGGDVSINIQNEGQPKDAEASTPRFDGEKFVIDVVMRDLSNNGPIRKSLRAGG